MLVRTKFHSRVLTEIAVGETIVRGLPGKLLAGHRQRRLDKFHFRSNHMELKYERFLLGQDNSLYGNCVPFAKEQTDKIDNYFTRKRRQCVKLCGIETSCCLRVLCYCCCEADYSYLVRCVVRQLSLHKVSCSFHPQLGVVSSSYLPFSWCHIFMSTIRFVCLKSMIIIITLSS